MLLPAVHVFPCLRCLETNILGCSKVNSVWHLFLMPNRSISVANLHFCSPHPHSRASSHTQGLHARLCCKPITAERSECCQARLDLWPIRCNTLLQCSPKFAWCSRKATKPWERPQLILHRALREGSVPRWPPKAISLCPAACRLISRVTKGT